MMFQSMTLAGPRSSIDTSSTSPGDSHPMHLQFTMTDPLPQSPPTHDGECVGCSPQLIDSCANDDGNIHLVGQRSQQTPPRRRRQRHLTDNGLPVGTRWLVMLTLAAASVNSFSLGGGISISKPTVAVTSKKTHQFRAHKGSTPLLVLDDELTTMTAPSEEGDQLPAVTLGPQRLSGVPGVEVISAGGSPQVFSPFLSLKPFPTTSQQRAPHSRHTTMSMSAAKATTSMFLNPGISSSSFSISGTMQHPSSSHHRHADDGSPRDDSNRRTEYDNRRGVLGFDIASSLPSVAETTSQRSSSALSSSRRSNVDLDSWNDPTTTNVNSRVDGNSLSGVEKSWTPPRAASPLIWPSSRLSEAGFAPGSTASSFFFRRPSTPSALKNNGGSATFTVTQNPTRLPPWFPFIPSKSQIESLKVSELREACAQRGLVKVRYLAPLQVVVLFRI